MPYAEPLTDQEIADRLDQLPGWERSEDSITKTFKIKPYPRGLALIALVVAAEEKMDHHADIEYRFGSVVFTITTHAANHQITAKDLELAERIEKASVGIAA
ncbi:4a-hydroxytetrahydrobiopterin dehydratase [Catenulispora yoronensis]|uniref:Putative pterin-4-alpha-carbinolamine dehydratase n=1 Tax=Catenulispora yoronensis TaxID=450799 RepID=A0ABN2VMT2_9ACTN